MNIRTGFAVAIAAIAIGGFAGAAGPATAATSATSTLAASVQAVTSSADRVAFVNSLPLLTEGAGGYHVLGLQQLLIHSVPQHASPLQGTGYFGATTKTEVQKFQRANGINPSGRVGVQTWAALMPKPSLGVCVSRRVIAPPNLIPGQKLTTDAQRDALFAFSYSSMHFSWLTLSQRQWRDIADEKGEPSTYHSEWVASIKAIQQRTGIPATGTYGSRTAEAISFLASISPYGCVS